MSHIEIGCQLINPEYKHILEFGVYKGNTITKIKNTVNSDIKIFGFDSFEGLPEDWSQYDGGVAGDGVCVKGFFSTEGVIPEVDGVTFYKGWFDKTLPEYLKIAEPIALLHIDCDLYSSTKTVLYGLIDYVRPGTIIVFDEWYYNNNPKYNDHEQKCFLEWINDYKIICELVNTNNRTEQQIVKILEINGK